MNTYNPLITVLMPVFNGERYLKESIDSILNQTCTDFEFIIIDDGSTDASVRIIESFTDPRILLLRNKINQGITKCLNRGLSLAKGEYVARMDADDISLPERFSQEFEFLTKNKDVGVVGCYAEKIDENNKVIGAIKYPQENELILWSLCFKNPIIHPAVMFRRDLVLEIGGYNIEFEQSQDHDLWCRLVGKTKFTNLPQTLLRYRVHKNCVSIQHHNNQLENSIPVCHKLISKLLDINIPIGDVETLWNKGQKDPCKLKQAAELINKLSQVFILDPQISLSGKNKIRHFASQRLLKLANQSISCPAKRSIVFSAFLLSPLYSTYKILIWQLKKIFLFSLRK